MKNRAIGKLIEAEREKAEMSRDDLSTELFLRFNLNVSDEQIRWVEKKSSNIPEWLWYAMAILKIDPSEIVKIIKT